MSKEIIKSDETVKIELAPSPELKRFDDLYYSTGNNLREMCRLSYKIVGDDEEKKNLFRDHIVNDLGMSKQTYSSLICAGKMYSNNPMLVDMSHTNIVELRGIADANTMAVPKNFYDVTKTTPEELVKASQKKIRELVKKYKGDDIGDPDATEDTDDKDDKNTKNPKQEVVDITPILDALAYAVSTLEIINDRYSADFEKDDNKLIHDTLFEMRRSIKKYTDKGEK